MMAEVLNKIICQHQKPVQLGLMSGHWNSLSFQYPVNIQYLLIRPIQSSFLL